jgi:very-short-patch-repair endonuclease
MKNNKTIDAEFFYGASPEIFLRAGELRKKMTLAEKLLWEELHAKRFLGLTFRRQHPINQFIADFYCHKIKLVIEIDGSIHEIEDFKEKDKGRDDEFENYGIKTLRFTNNDIINNMPEVLRSLKSICETLIQETTN